MVPFATAGNLAGTKHGFCGREGGVSTGAYASLNAGLGSSDLPAAVAENRRRAVAAVAPGAALATVHQVHSSLVVRAAAGIADADRARADGLVTDRPGLVLGVLGADCAPVLFADTEAGVVGAAHAGWKGALYGVLGAVVVEMEALGARRERIAAAIGPCIARSSYEVATAYAAPFLAIDRDYERFFTPGKPGHLQFDLEGFIVARLAAEGLRRIEALGLDTCALADRYFSYRRATHARESAYGLNVSLIALG